jgi:type IV secretory pathway VirB4 component
MAADNGLISLLPRIIDTDKIEDWIEKMEIYLMMKNENHLELLSMPQPPPARATLEIRDDYKKELALWNTRNSSSFSLIAKTCEKSPDVLTVLQTYYRGKKRDIPAEKMIAKELLDLLLARFIRQNQRMDRGI